MQAIPHAKMWPTLMLGGMGAGVDKYWEKPSPTLLTIDSLADAVMGQENTRWFKTAAVRCKAKATQGPRIQRLHVHLPFVLVLNDCDKTQT